MDVAASGGESCNGRDRSLGRMTKASDLLVAALENEGVGYIFAIPGEENLDVLESLRRSKIKLVLTRHEQAAGFMAATYGRLTGRAGVCLTTLGPGALNLTTAAAYAHLGAMPMVMITGQRRSGAAARRASRSSTLSRPCGRSPRWRPRSSQRRAFPPWFVALFGWRSRNGRARSFSNCPRISRPMMPQPRSSLHMPPSFRLRLRLRSSAPPP